jgi:hypothetical protein
MRPLLPLWVGPASLPRPPYRTEGNRAWCLCCAHGHWPAGPASQNARLAGETEAARVPLVGITGHKHASQSLTGGPSPYVSPSFARCCQLTNAAISTPRYGLDANWSAWKSRRPFIGLRARPWDQSRPTVKSVCCNKPPMPTRYLLGY